MNFKIINMNRFHHSNSFQIKNIIEKLIVLRINKTMRIHNIFLVMQKK